MSEPVFQQCQASVHFCGDDPYEKIGYRCELTAGHEGPHFVHILDDSLEDNGSYEGRPALQPVEIRWPIAKQQSEQDSASAKQPRLVGDSLPELEQRVLVLNGEIWEIAALMDLGDGSPPVWIFDCEQTVYDNISVWLPLPPVPGH